MREIFTYGSVGGAPGNRCFYLETVPTETIPEETKDQNVSTSSNQNYEYITLQNIKVPLNKNSNESVQDFVKKIIHLLIDNSLLSDNEIIKLQQKEYSKSKFHLQFPLLRKTSEGHTDHTGRGRYWSREIFGGQYYVCSQWWKDHNATYLVKIKQWLRSLCS